MTHLHLNDSGAGPAFEINLVRDRLGRLRRARAVYRFGLVAACVMLAVSALLCLRTVGHISTVIRNAAGVSRLSAELIGEGDLCGRLDTQRINALAKVGDFSRLVPLAEARVAWAPKLAALADALPPGMGVSVVRLASGDVFAEAPPEAPDPEAKKAPRRPPKITPPSMTFTIVYLPSAGTTRDPMGLLLDELRSADAFMRRMEFVRLEATEEDTWRDRSVILFRGLVKGAARPDET